MDIEVKITFDLRYDSYEPDPWIGEVTVTLPTGQSDVIPPELAAPSLRIFGSYGEPLHGRWGYLREKGGQKTREGSVVRKFSTAQEAVEWMLQMRDTVSEVLNAAFQRNAAAVRDLETMRQPDNVTILFRRIETLKRK